MFRLPVLLSLMLLAAGPAAAAPALRLSTDLAPAPVITPSAQTTLPAAVHLKLEEDAESGLGSLVLDKAMAMLGTDYQLGSNDEEAVDCSGLAQQVYRSAGLELPRTSGELLKSGTAISKTQLRPGDLMIYRWNRRRLHVAVYVEDGYIVHASPKAGRVVITELNHHWQQKLVAIRRLL